MNPTWRPSGEKNGLYPPSVPAIGGEVSWSRRRGRDRHRGRRRVAFVPERRGEIGGTREAVGRQLLERREHRGFDVRRNGVALRLKRARRLGHHPRHHRLRGGAGERRLGGQHLVQHAAEGVHVRAGGDLALAHRLLGTHVVRGAQGHPRLGHPGPAGLAGGEGDAEVGHQRRAVVQQDVLGLDVAVHHAVAVGVVERRGHLLGDADGIGHGELLLAGQPVAQGLPFDERHHVEQVAVGLTRIEQRQDVRVLQIGRELDLGQEPLGADHGRELGAEHLERDPPGVADVLGEVDGRHAAGADLALEAVAVRQGGLEAAEQFGHSVGGGGR
jgi:hypothetical protein